MWWSLRLTCSPDIMLPLFRGNGKLERVFRHWGNLVMRGTALSLFYFTCLIFHLDLLL